ncbi:tautomerase family protein [Aquitalea aquatica]|uniref:Tautomerase family protein n=1 Tax=Aquitalea aquatica TaxID=3044273 RepID=A0A838Y3P2_9NEIS|nr:tautomerase family protein [Aquitalea magnusonii]MBA4707972.1 tautomerase family protein [Aquitalea magnusonii]
MPYVRIALAAGKPPAWLSSISASLQQALEESFEVPAGDCFQVFQQCQAGELVFDRDYFSGGRSDDFILFHITAGRPRSAACKRAFFARLAERLAASPGLRQEDIMVVITTTELEDWSFGNGKSALPDHSFSHR